MLANIAKERMVLCEFHPLNVKDISVEEFHLVQIKQKDAIIIFTSKWGRYSNKLKKEINKIPREVCRDLPFYNIDVDIHDDFAKQYGVEGINTIPTMLIYQRGRLVERYDIGRWTYMMELIQDLQKGE